MDHSWVSHTCYMSTKSLGFWHMKKEHINKFPDEISAVSGAYYDNYRA